MMKKLKYYFLGIILAFYACSGVKFANSPTNKALPDSFTKRSLYPAGVAGYEFQDLVGNIIKIKANEDPVRIGVIRPDTYDNAVIPITDPNNYYKSRVQKGAEAQGSYLSFAAEFSAEQLAELELVDIARAGITLDNSTVFQQILTKATSWVQQHPKNDTSIKRLWIKSVVLTRRIYNDFTNVGAKASGQVGNVVGVSTGVYNKSEESDKSVIISFESFDIDEFVKVASGKDTTQMSITKLTEYLTDQLSYHEIIKGKIK